jgi:cathepsin A (carboxypeptidase C)
MRCLSVCFFAAVLASIAAASLVAPRHLTSTTWDEAGRRVTGTLRGTGSGYAPCDPTVTQRSGYFDIDAATEKHYFYWMFEAKTNPSTAPMLLWMTGGPGCSSELAVLAENGPCHIDFTTGALYSNPHSWNNVANVIYIDQPAGVGFSYTNNTSGYDFNETMVANDMYKFVQSFLKAYPQYLNNDFFVYGESYGGHFAPATAHRIWQGNNNNEGTKVNLKGLSVGNGMTQPVVQLQWYAHLAFEWCTTVLGSPCITQQAYATAIQQLPQCIAEIKTCNDNANATGCQTAMNDCLGSQLGPFEQTGLNVYDVRKQCIGELCYNFTFQTNFMNEPTVQASLGVATQNITWSPCNMNVNQMFGKDWMRNFDQYVTDLLDADIRVLIYSGDVDFICNWLGNKAWTLGLQWKQGDAFRATQDFPWWMSAVPAGRVRTVSSAKNKLQFTFLQIHDAGHMVPMDQPQRALEMVRKFLTDEAFHLFDGPM